MSVCRLVGWSVGRITHSFDDPSGAPNSFLSSTTQIKDESTEAMYGIFLPIIISFFSFVKDWRLSFGLGGRGLNPRGDQWMDRRTDGERGGQISPYRVSAQKVSIHACGACV